VGCAECGSPLGVFACGLGGGPGRGRVDPSLLQVLMEPGDVGGGWSVALAAAAASCSRVGLSPAPVHLVDELCAGAAELRASKRVWRSAIPQHRRAWSVPPR
jgi:hypothetical protein